MIFGVICQLEDASTGKCETHSATQSRTLLEMELKPLIAEIDLTTEVDQRIGGVLWRQAEGHRSAEENTRINKHTNPAYMIEVDENDVALFEPRPLKDEALSEQPRAKSIAD